MKHQLSVSRPNLLGLLTSVALMLAGTVSASADETNPVVVELFTSQGCYSCPPAEAYLGELAQQPGVLALEWHVDYWDDLIYGAAGKWKDPFSDPAFTARQRTYNQTIRNTRSVYTPQMVIGGWLEVVGSHRGKVQRAMEKAAENQHITMTIEPKNGGMTVLLPGGAAKTQAANVLLLVFDKSHKTQVKSGENKGKTLVSHNIVRSVLGIGPYNGQAVSHRLAELPLGPGQGCAVLVQERNGGPVLAGDYCPGSGPDASSREKP